MSTIDVLIPTPTNPRISIKHFFFVFSPLPLFAQPKKKHSYDNPEAPRPTFRWPDRRAPSLDHRCSAVNSMRTHRQLFRRRRAWCVDNSPTRHRPDCKFFVFLFLFISTSSERKNPQLIGLLQKTKRKIIETGDPIIVYFSRSLFLLFFFHFISSY